MLRPCAACASTRSPTRKASERRLAPMGSSRYTSFSLVTGAAMGIVGRIEVGEAGANAARARHHAGDAEADVVGALVADDLQRHARHDLAFDGRGAVFVHQLARERGEEAAHRRAEAHAGNVDVEAGALDSRLFGCAQASSSPSPRIIERLGNHDLRDGVGRAVLGQLRAGQAAIELASAGAGTLPSLGTKRRARP